MAYHSFGGEVGASNTPTIRRLTPSRRHQLSWIAPGTAREPIISVDSIEVALFIYLLLHNEKIRDVIDTSERRARSCRAALLRPVVSSVAVAVEIDCAAAGPTGLYAATPASHFFFRRR
jgi:hypothetical protein